MKFKAAFSHRGLCECLTIDADYETYIEHGAAIAKEYGLDQLPDFFIKQREKWWKLDDKGEICGVEFCAADYSEEDK